MAGCVPNWNLKTIKAYDGLYGAIAIQHRTSMAKNKPITPNSPRYQHSPDGTSIFDHLLDDESDAQFTPQQTRPTKARPGTPAKIAVLVRRLERGEELHHEKDYRPVSKHWMRIIQDIEMEVFSNVR